MSDIEKLDLIGCGVNIGSRWSKQNTIEELEKLKKRINQLSLGKWYVGRLDGKTEEVASMEEINFVFDKRLSELKGKNKE